MRPVLQIVLLLLISLVLVSGKKSRAFKSFVIDFECKTRDKSQCAKAEKAFQRAASYLDVVIQTKRTIKVKTVFASFCHYLQKCEFDTLAQVVDSPYQRVNSTGEVEFVYPQPLAKQLSSFEFQWQEYDFVVELNSDVPSNTKSRSRFWFPEDKDNIKPEQYDLEYVALHEMLHGLGIKSSWTSVSLPEFSKSKLVTPYMQSLGNMNSFGSLQIFDKFIYDALGNKPVSDLYKTIQKEGWNQWRSDWKRKFKSSDSFIASQKLYRLSTKKKALELRLPAVSKKASLKFQKAGIEYTPGPVSITLHTGYVPFREGCSLSHFDQSIYSGTADFLMRPEAQSGVTLMQITPHNGFPVGPLTIRLLHEMGYKISNDTLPQLGLGSSGSSPTSINLLGILLIIFLIQ